MWKLTCAALTDTQAREHLSAHERGVLIMKVLQKRPWHDVAQALKLTGRAQVIEGLRCALRPLLLHYGDEALCEEAQRLSRTP